jgi:hypothetical protein
MLSARAIKALSKVGLDVPMDKSVNDILDVTGYKLSDLLLATEVEYEKVFNLFC